MCKLVQPDEQRNERKKKKKDNKMTENMVDILGQGYALQVFPHIYATCQKGQA